MGKLRKLSSKEICKILEDYGFICVRQRGSHIIMQKMLENSTITVPVPLCKEMKTGTSLSIIRQSGLNRSLFEI